MSSVCRKKPHVGDIGTKFTALFRSDCDDDSSDDIIDISSATTKELIFTPPSGVTKTVPGAFVGGSPLGSDGKLRYTTVASFLDEAGWWTVRGYVVTPSGTWHSTLYKFEVFEV